MKSATESQSALRAMDMYFKSPSRSRTNAAGDIYTAGRFELLFDRMGERIKAIVIAGYEPPNWQAKARETVLHKIERSLNPLLRSQGPEIQNENAVRRYASALLDRIGDLSAMSWQAALADALSVLETSDADRARSNAMRVLVSVDQLRNPLIEARVLNELRMEEINFIRLTEEGQKTIEATCSRVIADWLRDTLAVPQQHCVFAASAVMHAIRTYRLDLQQAIKLLDLPGALIEQRSPLPETAITGCVCAGIARTMIKQRGVAAKVAEDRAPQVETLMRRYALDWEEALALADLTNELAPDPPSPGNEGPGISTATRNMANGTSMPLPADLDKARAVQQVMQRDRCDVKTALRVVARRIRALPEICRAFPEAARPDIVSGMPARLSCALSESSCELFSHAVRTLEKEKKTGWRAPNSPVDIPVSDLYLLDSNRCLQLALKDHRGFQLFDDRNADSLTPAIHAFAGDDQVMTAICDSCNQTIMGSILSIIQHKELALADSSPFVPLPPDEETGHETRRLWHCAAIEDNDYLVIRHLYLEKTWQVLKPMSSDVWTINKGQDWQGDVSPMNAGWTADFSYAFKLSELKQGIRNPQLRRCQYTLAVDLDWDTIDATLAAREGSQPRQALAHGIPQ